VCVCVLALVLYTARGGVVLGRVWGVWGGGGGRVLAYVRACVRVRERVCVCVCRIVRKSVWVGMMRVCLCVCVCAVCVRPCVRVCACMVVFWFSSYDRAHRRFVGHSVCVCWGEGGACL